MNNARFMFGLDVIFNFLLRLEHAKSITHINVLSTSDESVWLSDKSGVCCLVMEVELISFTVMCNYKLYVTDVGFFFC